MMMVSAPAKLNLILEVLKKRPDGFHEVRSIVQTTSFGDKLNFGAAPAVEYRCNDKEWSASKSLVSRAVDLLKNTSRSRQGAIIEIEKHIPLNSGLGGDSSDAAAVLRGLNMLWNLKLSLRDLISLATLLGSAVPLFLYGGTLLAEGRGEIIRPLHPMPHMTAILLMPPLPRTENKTKQLYAQLNVRNYTDGKMALEFMNMLEGRAGKAAGLYNVFDQVGLRFFVGLEQYRQKFIAAGATDVHLAGSGPTLFTLLRDEVKASEIVKRLQKEGLETYLTDY